MQQMTPIYQMYVDAVQGQAKAQEAQQELQINKMKMGMEALTLQQQLAERQITAQVWGQMNQGNGQETRPDSVTAGSTPNANPATGSDPTLRTADIYDQLAQKLGPINPKSSMEYANKAGEIRNRYYTQQKDMITMRKEQANQVANLFGSVKDQAEYTEALTTLSSKYGIDISQFNLSGNLQQDQPRLEALAKQSQTYSQKMTAAHESTEEQIGFANYNEKARHDRVDEGLSAAKVNVQVEEKNLRAQWQKFDMDYKSRSEARAQAGVTDRDEQKLTSAKKFAGTVNTKTDTPYIQGVIAADPVLSTLSPQQQKMITAEINLRARNELQKGVTKASDLPSADDFMAAADKAAADIKKRVTPGEKHFFSSDTPAKVGPRTVQAPPKGGPLPSTITSMSQLTAKSPGDQVTINGKMYKVTKKGSKPDGSDTELSEIK